MAIRRGMDKRLYLPEWANVYTRIGDDGLRIYTVPLPKRVIKFNKPYGVLSQFTWSGGERRPTLADHIRLPGVYPIGRLDHDSEGLMLLTDDGALQHRLSDPRTGHPRTYWVQVERVPDEPALESLRRGVMIQGKRTQPAKVRLLETEPQLPPRVPPVRFRKNVPTAWLEMTLTEGRNRQVRRMTAAVGHPTLRLVRVAIGGVRLDDLRVGEWRELDPRERASLPPHNGRSHSMKTDVH